MSRWQQEEDRFAIRYTQRENGGKHAALNDGVRTAEGSHVLILDSDDWLLPHATKDLATWIAGVKDDVSLAGVAGLKVDLAGNPLGGWPVGRRASHIDASNLERARHGLGGDKAEAYRVDVLRKHPFPVFPNEKFLEEAMVWDAIAASGYKLRWFTHPIYGVEYLPGGLTANAVSNRVVSFSGYTLYVRQALRLKPWSERIRIAAMFMEVAEKRSLTSRDSAALVGAPVFSVNLAIRVRGVVRQLVKSTSRCRSRQ